MAEAAARPTGRCAPTAAAHRHALVQIPPPQMRQDERGAPPPETERAEPVVARRRVAAARHAPRRVTVIRPAASNGKVGNRRFACSSLL